MDKWKRMIPYLAVLAVDFYLLAGADTGYGFGDGHAADGNTARLFCVFFGLRYQKLVLYLVLRHSGGAVCSDYLHLL